MARLLEHPAIWRGRSAARADVLPTGFAALDECLPGGGWPRTGLIELLIPRLGVGELYLFMPALAALTHRSCARWCAWISPPFVPFAPALAAHGVAVERVLVVQAPRALWALEQALGSGACDAVLAWARSLPAREVRRLQLAAERGRTLGILFRPRRAAREPSCAVLRARLEPAGQDGLAGQFTLLKSRGGLHRPIRLVWPSARI